MCFKKMVNNLLEIKLLHFSVFVFVPTDLSVVAVFKVYFQTCLYTTCNSTCSLYQKKKANDHIILYIDSQ